MSWYRFQLHITVNCKGPSVGIFKESNPQRSRVTTVCRFGLSLSSPLLLTAVRLTRICHRPLEINVNTPGNCFPQNLGFYSTSLVGRCNLRTQFAPPSLFKHVRLIAPPQLVPAVQRRQQQTADLTDVGLRQPAADVVGRPLQIGQLRPVAHRQSNEGSQIEVWRRWGRCSLTSRRFCGWWTLLFLCLAAAGAAPATRLFATRRIGHRLYNHNFFGKDTLATAGGRRDTERASILADRRPTQLVADCRRLRAGRVFTYVYSRSRFCIIPCTPVEDLR